MNGSSSDGPSQRSGPSEADEIAFDGFLGALIRKGTIQAGPFAGLRLGRESSWSGLAPYFIGSYECELHEPIEELIPKGYRTVVNIGCADGYYAVGFAVRLPDSNVFAYDIDTHSQAVCAATAAANGVDARVHVRGRCDTAELDSLVGRETLLVVDCEGAEIDLLHPDDAPGLREADLIVELHDFVDPTISSVIVDRFSSTHDIKIIDVALRNPSQFHALDGQPPWVQFLALFEGRPTEPHPMQWAIMQARL